MTLFPIFLTGDKNLLVFHIPMAYCLLSHLALFTAYPRVLYACFSVLELACLPVPREDPCLIHFAFSMINSDIYMAGVQYGLVSQLREVFHFFQFC